MAGSSGSDDAVVDCLAASSSDSGEVDYLGGGQRCADCLAASSSDSGEVDYLGGGQRCATAKQRAKQRAHTPGRIAERPVEARRTHAYRMLAAKAKKKSEKQDREKHALFSGGLQELRSSGFVRRGVCTRKLTFVKRLKRLKILKVRRSRLNHHGACGITDVKRT